MERNESGRRGPRRVVALGAAITALLAALGLVSPQHVEPIVDVVVAGAALAE